MNIIRSAFGFTKSVSALRWFLIFLASTTIVIYVLIYTQLPSYTFFVTGETPFNNASANKILHSLEKGRLKIDSRGRIILLKDYARPYSDVYVTYRNKQIAFVLLPSYRDHDSSSFGCYLYTRKPFNPPKNINAIPRYVQAIGPARGATGHETQILNLQLDTKVSNDNWYHAIGHW